MTEINKEKAQEKKYGAIGCLVIIGIIIIISLIRTGPQNSDRVQSNNGNEINNPFLYIPAMSTWDGVATAIKNYLKENANDPKSIKYIECSYMMEFQNGIFGQRVKFRGKNIYGGLVINEFIFFIEGVDYNAKVFATSTMDEFLLNDDLKIIAKYDSEGKRIN